MLRNDFLLTSTSGKEVSMPDPEDVIKTAIQSAFETYSREDDPDWRSSAWIKPEECEHLTKVILFQLMTNGFRIVKLAPDVRP
jgi:hypothetical protein